MTTDIQKANADLERALRATGAAANEAIAAGRRQMIASQAAIDAAGSNEPPTNEPPTNEPPTNEPPATDYNEPPLPSPSDVTYITPDMMTRWAERGGMLGERSPSGLRDSIIEEGGPDITRLGKDPKRVVFEGFDWKDVSAVGWTELVGHGHEVWFNRCTATGVNSGLSFNSKSEPGSARVILRDCMMLDAVDLGSPEDGSVEMGAFCNDTRGKYQLWVYGSLIHNAGHDGTAAYRERYCSERDGGVYQSNFGSGTRIVNSVIGSFGSWGVKGGWPAVEILGSVFLDGGYAAYVGADGGDAARWGNPKTYANLIDNVIYGMTDLPRRDRVLGSGFWFQGDANILCENNVVANPVPLIRRDDGSLRDQSAFVCRMEGGKEPTVRGGGNRVYGYGGRTLARQQGATGSGVDIGVEHFDRCREIDVTAFCNRLRRDGPSAVRSARGAALDLMGIAQ